ncbi:MAG: DUF4147 domain-containing protein [Chloroflexi bacterium]|nr:DUF4147 domain-containing protein [Chloroflexota bacterium]
MLQIMLPDTAVKNHLCQQDHLYHIGGVPFDPEHGRLFLISVGKAAIPMSQAALDILGDTIHAGVGITKQIVANVQLTIDNFQLYIGEHPVSGPKSVLATTAVANLLAQTHADDLVLCLISGGTSALLTQPLLSLEDWQALNQALLASGCTIHEFNIVRRQLDGVKGGGLAQMAAPATVVSLILSDVVGSDLAAVGSGPTVFTSETGPEALSILQRYQVADVLDTAVYQRIYYTLQNLPVPPPSTQPPVTNRIIGDVRQAAEAARQQTLSSGFTTTIITTHLEGEARTAGQFAAAIGKDLLPGHCAILGGETTVALRGDGIGGRNLETALAAAIALEGWPHITIATFATDGDDGPTSAAGAVVTGEAISYGRNLGLDAHRYLANNDSYSYFKKLEDDGRGSRCLIITGPTGTNVNDLIFIFRKT